MSVPDEMPPAREPTDPQAIILAGDALIAVIACGSRWLVMDKPCGMSIHNDPGQDLCSQALAAVRAGRLPAVSRDLPGMHAVHRIDRDTSGIVLLAGDSETLAFFGRQFVEKTVRKRYLAVVHGRLEGQTQDQEWIDWNWPLADAAGGRNDPVGKGKRMPCITRCRVVLHSPHYTLVECEPLSGRKHQIRRHAKLAGHPVVGDRRYGSARSLAYLLRHHAFNRLALHADSLTLRLPGEDQKTTFRSGGLPQQLRRLLDNDR
jgi:23S rRNA-/tRNA-specific pseudouridylate synthase